MKLFLSLLTVTTMSIQFVSAQQTPFTARVYEIVEPTAFPTIASISPAVGNVEMPVGITILGTGFTANTAVLVSDCTVLEVERISSTELWVEVVPESVGLKTVTVISGEQSAVASVGAITISAKALFDETFSINRSAPIGNAVTQYSTDSGFGRWKCKFLVNSTVSGGVWNLLSTDASGRLWDIETRQPSGGRIHFARVTTRTGGGHDSRPLTLCNEILSSPGHIETGTGGIYGFQSKTGSGSAEDGRYLINGTSRRTFFRKSFWTESTAFEIAILERDQAGAVLLWKNGSTWQILHVTDIDLGPVKLGVLNGTAQFGAYDRLATYETGWRLDPLVSDSFSRANETTISDSDGNGVTEKGGSGISPITTGSPAVASNLLTSTSGASIVVWESGQADVWALAKVTPVDGAPAGVILRYVDASNYWLAEIDSSADSIYLIEVTNGTRTTRATGNLSTDATPGTINSGTEYDVQICSIGTEIRAWIDGSAVTSTHAPFVTFTSSQHQAGTKVGLRVNAGASARKFAAFQSLQSLPSF